MPDKKIVLVIEDNLLNMKLAADLLELNGFAVLKATTGKEALNILRDNLPQLILMDIHLPDIDGFKLLEIVRSDKKSAGIKIIAVTASVMREDMGSGLYAKFDGLIDKPIDIKKFIATIKEKIGS